jgi:cell wall-associated NlpC family hydrolase
VDHLETRQRMVAEARTWLRTPYHHMAEIKGVGVDCGKLVLCILSNAGAIDHADFGSYPKDWMLARENPFLEDLFRAHFVIVDAPQPGDAMLFRVGRTYCHLALVTIAEPLTLLHATPGYGFVVEEAAEGVARIKRHMSDALIGRARALA